LPDAATVTAAPERSGFFWCKQRLNPGDFMDKMTLAKLFNMTELPKHQITSLLGIFYTIIPDDARHRKIIGADQ
jgi:hypothetical protein